MSPDPSSEMLIYKSPSTTQPIHLRMHHGSDSHSTSPYLGPHLRPHISMPPRVSLFPFCLGWTFQVRELRVHNFLWNSAKSSGLSLASVFPSLQWGHQGVGEGLGYVRVPGKQVASSFYSLTLVMLLPLLPKSHYHHDQKQPPLLAHTHS